MFCNCILILKLILFHNSFYKPIQNKNKENHYWSESLSSFLKKMPLRPPIDPIENIKNGFFGQDPKKKLLNFTFPSSAFLLRLIF